MVTKTYRPYNLCDSSDSNDSCDSIDNVTVVTKKNFTQKKLYFQKNFLTFLICKKNISPKNSKAQIVMKLKNSNCDETQRLKLY